MLLFWPDCSSSTAEYSECDGDEFEVRSFDSGERLESEAMCIEDSDWHQYPLTIDACDRSKHHAVKTTVDDKILILRPAAYIRLDHHQINIKVV